MKKWFNYIKLFWYFSVNWNPVLAGFILWHEVRGEKKYGIATSKPVELSELTITNGNLSQSSRYEAVNYFILEALLSRLRTIAGETSFTDLGCGKGRAMVVAAHYGFTKISGVDFAKEVCSVAEQHLQQLRVQFPQMEYGLHCQNVLDYDIQPNESVFFLFNPFSDEIISRFLEKVNISTARHPRTIYFLYVSPKHVETFFEFEYEPVYRKRKLKWLDGVILKKEMQHPASAAIL
ncbi:class I SAM-dependent methyltransferase [Agriterribacter sp.]|uniref:class I SAM-dependent methyltransferase n=1 Tax=Agriterribacter sp. TaxID=2821509 RepID=UPI002BB1677D|nr:class I SAM-dependent methyltransferase [Agriterribacter sp.]HRO47758.1 class I SAM-dependent methyltransferase [Agriterribacter sp.]HRQ18356.1 class I SAM-dependent methyltransferase [Agriterribacter sp.]